MCGIAGILDIRHGPGPTRRDLEAMNGQLRHRGPDEAGYYLDDHAGLAHSRLSIIDLASGQQPLASADGELQVVFNGEIFNFVELRRELERHGHVFRTNSDTEVIVHLYQRHGDDFVHHLNGQFAIALWDRQKRRLVLARDRVGIRPLFYTLAQGRFCFASEVKALLALPGVAARISAKALAEIFTFWAVQPPATVFEGIWSLPPGCLMTVVAGEGTRTVRRYWDGTFPEEGYADSRSTDDYAEELRALLEDAVRIQLRADVPVGAYLSGGLDSAIVASVIRHRSDTPLRTFSLGFEDAEFDETPYQQEMVRHLGSEHTAVTCRRADIAAAFPAAIWHAETPLVRTGPVPLMLLSRVVRDQGYKVVLTGEGADEVFGGYDLFKEARVRRFWARQPHSRIRPLIFDRLYPYLAHSPVGGGALAREFFRQGQDRPDAPGFGHLTRWNTTRRIWRFFGRDVREELEGWDPVASLERGLPGSFGKWAPLARDQYIEAHTLLSGYLLSSQGDRMAMAHSVEGRYPFLDHRLIEFAAGLPPRYKLMGLKEKFILRRAMAPLLPPATASRTKQPYRAPDSQSFFAGGVPADCVTDLFDPARIRQTGLFDPAAASRLFEKCRRGEAVGFADNMAFVGIASTLLLSDMFCAGVPKAIAA